MTATRKVTSTYCSVKPIVPDFFMGRKQTRGIGRLSILTHSWTASTRVLSSARATRSAWWVAEAREGCSLVGMHAIRQTSSSSENLPGISKDEYSFSHALPKLSWQDQTGHLHFYTFLKSFSKYKITIPWHFLELSKFAILRISNARSIKISKQRCLTGNLQILTCPTILPRDADLYQ